jgi:Flp pilus assembly protein TadD
VLRDKGEPGRAVQYFRAAIRIDPAYAHSYRNLAQILLREDPHSAEGLDLLRTAVFLRPRTTDYLMELGLAVRDAGRLAEALATFREWCDREPTNPWGYANTGWVLHLAGDHAGGIAAYHTAISIAPKSAKFRSEMGVVLAAKGDLTGAVFQHEEAVRLDGAKTPLYRERLEAARKHLAAGRTTPPPPEKRGP